MRKRTARPLVPVAGVLARLSPGTALGLIALLLLSGGGAYAASRSKGLTRAQVIALIKRHARRGPEGREGPSGRDGAPGREGPEGRQGVRGGEGPAGSEGPPGPVGSEGPIGGEGARGEAGPTGPQGPQGAEGSEGPRGEPGPQGIPGVDGADGASARAVPFSGEGGGCAEGGVAVESAAPTVYVCHGSPWAAGGTLPSGATETGAWSVRGTAAKEGESRATTLSFPIPLAVAPAATFVPLGGSDPACPGSVYNPTSPHPGRLCVYEGEAPVVHRGGLVFAAFVGIGGGFGSGTTGAEIAFTTAKPASAGEEVSAEGTFAVTAG